MYNLEKILVKDFKEHISCDNSPLEILTYATEFNYVSGKIDLLASNEKQQLIAFEAKLLKWKVALNQAYRNSSFAEYSYVVVPNNIIDRVKKFKNEFDKRGIGLISVNDEGIEIIFKSKYKKPIQPWLKQKGISFLNRS